MLDEIVNEFNKKYAPEKAVCSYSKDESQHIFDVEIKFDNSAGCGMNKKVSIEEPFTDEQIDAKLTYMFLTVKNSIGKYA